MPRCMPKTKQLRKRLGTDGQHRNGTQSNRDKTASGLSDTATPEMSQLGGSESPIKRASLIGPKDFPINIVGGYRFPQAKPLGRVRQP